jgi:opacity protein-like surface antigen
MKKRWLLTVALIGMCAWPAAARAESGDLFGVGANYWTMLDNIDVHSIDNNGFSWLLTYQFNLAPLFKFETDVEMFPEGFQGVPSASYAPEVYLVIGSWIYGAVGAGILYADNEFADDPFYALRAGLDFELVPQVHLDLNLNYRFAEWTTKDAITEDISADTMMLGAAVRIEF